MATDLTTDLQRFRDHLDDVLRRGERDRSPEDVLDEWRTANPSPDVLAEDVAAVREAIADMEAGDRGVDAFVALRETCEKHGLPYPE